MRKRLWVAGLLASTLLAGRAEAQSTQCVTNARAGGTVNALTVPLLPCGLATNILILTLTGANTSADVTLQMAGFPALTVLRNDRTALQIGDLPGANAVVMLTGTGSNWLVLQGNAGNPLPIPVPVADGGTERITLTANGVLYGDGTNPIGMTAAGTTGQLLIGTTSAAPSWLTAGTTGQVLGANTGAAPSWSALSSLGVTSLSFGSTGLTPSSATTGAITVAGTLGLGNGGTGGTTVANFWTNFGQSSTSAILSPSGAGTVTINPNTAGTLNNLVIGGSTPLAGTFTGLTATGAVSLSPANNNVVLSPTGTGLVTVNPATAGTLDNLAIGGTTPLAGAFTTLATGVAGLSNGALSIKGSTSGVITAQPQAAAGTYNWNWPTSAGVAGNPLLSGGGAASPMVYGTLSGNTSTFVTASGAFTTGNCVSADASGNLVDNGTPCGTGGSGTVTSSTAGQVAYYPASSAVVAGNSNLTISGGAVTVGVTATTTGTVGLSGATSGKVTVQPQAAAGTYNFNLPTTAGTTGQFLTSAGGGGSAMTWSSAGLAAISAQTIDFNAASGAAYCVDTTGGEVEATLPASPANNDAILLVACSNYSTNNLVILRNGNNVQGLAENMTVSTDNASFHLVFVTSYGWRMY